MIVYSCKFAAVSFLVLCSAVVFCSAAQIKVGLYPYIPDLNKDRLQSYKEKVQNEFRKYCVETLRISDCSVEVVADYNVYDPYSKNLPDYLENQGFDILEIDTFSLGMYISGMLYTNVFCMLVLGFLHYYFGRFNLNVHLAVQ